MISFATSPNTALAVHRSPAMAAEQLSRQEVIYLGLAPCGGSSGLRKPSLDGIEKFPVDDSGNTVFYANVLVSISTDVADVLEHHLKATAVEFSIFCGFISCRIEFSSNFRNTYPIGVERKGFLHNMGGIWVYDQLMIFNFIPEWNVSPDTMALQSGFTHTSRDFLR